MAFCAAGEVLSVAAQFMEEQMHPVTVIGAYLKALDDALCILDQELAVPIDLTNETAVSEGRSKTSVACWVVARMQTNGWLLA